MHATADPRPGVTVVIPVKDRARLLGETLRSVAAQTQPPERVIVVDDGSKDRSAAVAREAGAQVIASRQGGLLAAGARNAGLEKVETELVWFLDSDDLLVPSAIERLAAVMAASPGVPFCFGRALVAEQRASGWRPKSITGPHEGELGDMHGALFANNFVASCSALARTADVRRVGGYSAKYVPNEDHQLWIALTALGAPVFVPSVVGVNRRHPGNLMDPVWAAPTAEEVTAMADEDPRLAAWRPERLGVQWFEITLEAIKRRQPAAAGRATWRLLLREPHRRRIASAAFTRWRTRAATPALAEDAWRSDDGLRRFLSTYE